MSTSLTLRLCLNVTCKQEFIPIIPKQVYCTRKCYARKWYLGVKVTKKNMPSWRCPNCLVVSKLDFKPKSTKLKWYGYACPNCGHRPL